MDQPKSPPPLVPADPAGVKPVGKAANFFTVAAGILILIVEYVLKGLWAFIRFFLPRWMK